MHGTMLHCSRFVSVHRISFPTNGEPPNRRVGPRAPAIEAPSRSNTSEAVRRSRVAPRDSHEAKGVEANHNRVNGERRKQHDTITAIRVDIQDTQDVIEETGNRADEAHRADKAMVKRLEGELENERQNAKKQEQTINGLKKKLKKATENQARIFCGVAVWRVRGRGSSPRCVCTVPCARPHADHRRFSWSCAVCSCLVWWFRCWWRCSSAWE